MPEGDTIHHAANRIRPVLEGRVPDEIRTPQPRHGADRWPERLAGRRVARVEARGKHLFLHFEGGLVLHSHLRMTGAWAVNRAGERWRRSPRRAWLVMRADGADVVQFDGPLLELMTASRARADLRLAALGPDVLGEGFDENLVIRRIREDDPTRPLGDALVDQRTLCGIGNIWKSESCFAAAADPWKALAQTADADIRSAVRFARERMAQSARDGYEARPRAVYGRAGRAVSALRGGDPLRRPGRAQPHDLLVRGMPALIRVGHKGADGLVRGNTLASFDAALEAGVDMIEFDVLAARRGPAIHVAHDYGALDRRDPLTLAAALAHLASPPFAAVHLQLDIKRSGCEERVLAALDASGTRSRAFISTGRWGVLKRMRVLAPEIPRGWTVPEIPGVTGTPVLTATLGRLYRDRLPARAAARIRAGAITALVPHWMLVTARLVEAVRGAGGEIYPWTVDDGAEIARLAALGVTGVITNDPRLFAAIVHTEAL